MRKGFLVLALSVSWFAAARNERFGAEPGGATVRRLRKMFSYFHSSTVFQERRGTELILTHERFRSVEAVAKHEHGWMGCLDKLEKLAEPAEGSRQGW